MFALIGINFSNRGINKYTEKEEEEEEVSWAISHS